MEDVAIILVSTLGFILVLLNNLTLVVIGSSLGIISLLLSILLTKLTTVTKVSTVIVSSITILLGIIWLVFFTFALK